MASITEQEFIDLHSAAWRELESETAYFNKHMGRLRNRIDSGSLTRERVDHYIELYNQVANHLAYSRTFYGETQTSEYLNRLAGNAHAVIYTKTVLRPGAALSFLGKGFPKLFRQEIRFFIVALLAFFIAGLIAFIYVSIDGRNALAFVDEFTLMNLREEGSYDDFTASMASLNGSYIGSNNIFVCLQAFAGGLTLGIYTLYMLIQNGIIIGVLGAVYASKGSSAFFWSLILPHGVTELFSIFLSGAAGFMIGMAIIRPGKLTRKTALVEAGKKSLKLMIMAVLFLIPSALIESFFTPLDLPYWSKFVFSIGMFVLLTLYLCIGVIREIKDKRKGTAGDLNDMQITE